MTPLRQFKGLPTEVIRKAEGKQFVGVVALYCVSLLIVMFDSPGTAISTSLLPKSEN